MRTGRPATMAANGMVSTPHHLASQAGLKVLREGGNAVDAAIAANAVLAVVMPASCGIGGDAFFMVWDPDREKLVGLNGSGRAPAGLSIDTVRASGNTTMPGRGPHAITVPGAIEAWARMLDRYGTRELGSLLGDAITYARDGFPITRSLSQSIGRSLDVIGSDPAARRQYLPSAEIPEPGSRLVQPALATTLQTVARKGASEFYTGAIAERLVRGLNTAGSPMSLDDLANHKSNWVTPLNTTFRGFDIHEMPPNTQGITALQMLNIANGWKPAGFEVNSVDQIHHFVEAKKLAFADRDRYVGDPDFVDVPIERLNSAEYASELRDRIDPARATVDLEDSPGKGGTVYLCAFDSNGMAVSLIQSLFQSFGSGIVAEGTGVVLQNRGASFTLEDGAANSLQPGKRPLHTLIPGMVMRDGRPWTVFGTMGGHGQAQTHLQLLTKMIDFEMDPQEAIESPRWVAGKTLETESEHLLRVEPEVGESVIAGLRERGHEVLETESFSSLMGHAQAIRVDWERGVLIGGADPRADGCALGW